MLTAELQGMMDEIVSMEHKLAIMEADSMAMDHLAGYQGFKRFHRYRSRDRFEHALYLSNFLLDHCQYMPKIIVTYETMKNTPPTLLSALIYMYEQNSSQIDLLELANEKSVSEHELHLAGKLCDMIKDQKEECSHYYRIIQEITNVESNKVFIQMFSEKLHAKYKKKEKECQGKEY